MGTVFTVAEWRFIPVSAVKGVLVISRIPAPTVIVVVSPPIIVIVYRFFNCLHAKSCAGKT
jgi:hypothetical protein